MGLPLAELLLQALWSLKEALTPAHIPCTLCPAYTRMFCIKINRSHHLLRCKYSLSLALKRESLSPAEPPSRRCGTAGRKASLVIAVRMNEERWLPLLFISSKEPLPQAALIPGISKWNQDELYSITESTHICIPLPFTNLTSSISAISTSNERYSKETISS